MNEDMVLKVSDIYAHAEEKAWDIDNKINKLLNQYCDNNFVDDDNKINEYVRTKLLSAQKELDEFIDVMFNCTSNVKEALREK